MKTRHLVPSFLVFLLVTGLAHASIADDMYSAIQNHDLARATQLVKNGYPLNKSVKQDNGYDFYALATAAFCYGGSASIVSMFLDNKADPNLAPDGEYTPLLWAIRSMTRPLESDPMRVQVFRLIQLGANVSYIDETTGRTPLHGAAGIGDRELVHVMLKAGADPKASAKPGWVEGTAADYARLGGWVELALELEGKNTTSYKLGLHYAAKQGDIKLVQAALNRGLDSNEAEPLSKLTPLHYAVEADSLDCVKLLLDYGADPNVVNYAGISPLRNAIVKYKIPLGKALIDAGARGDNEQTQGCGAYLTEFLWAYEYSVFELAEYMLSRNAINARESVVLDRFWGYRGEAEIKLAQLLIQKGAKVSKTHITRLETQDPNDGYATNRAKLLNLLGKAVRPSTAKDTFSAPVPIRSVELRNKAGQILLNASL